MRWDALFDDLETQLAAGERQGLDSEIMERTRLEESAVELADRLRGSLGLPVVVRLVSGSTFQGTLSHAGSEVIVLDEPRHQVLVPHAAAACYFGLSRLAVPEASRVRQGLGLASALRALARDRAGLAVLLAGGASGETTVHGVIDRVGRDYLDLAVTGEGEERRAANVRQVATVPLAALAGIRSARTPGYPAPR